MIEIDSENLSVIHGERYDYSKVDYKNAKTKVLIGCQRHRYFSQTPDNHLTSNGCPKCGYETISNKCKMGTEQFMEKCQKLYGNKYTYENVVYVNNHTLVSITCPIHGVFQRTPSNFFKGIECSECRFGKDDNSKVCQRN